MTQPPQPLSAEEEAELRRVAASWPEVSMEGERATQFYSAVRRLLATLDAARDSAGLDEGQSNDFRRDYLALSEPKSLATPWQDPDHGRGTE